MKLEGASQNEMVATDTTEQSVFETIQDGVVFHGESEAIFGFDRRCWLAELSLVLSQKPRFRQFVKNQGFFENCGFQEVFQKKTNIPLESARRALSN